VVEGVRVVPIIFRFFALMVEVPSGFLAGGFDEVDLSGFSIVGSIVALVLGSLRRLGPTTLIFSLALVAGVAFFSTIVTADETAGVTFSLARTRVVVLPSKLLDRLSMDVREFGKDFGNLEGKFG
jgi:hypothetical protein